MEWVIVFFRCMVKLKHTRQSGFTALETCKKIIALCLSAFLFSICLNGQVTSTTKTGISYDIIVDTVYSRVAIQFNPDRMILNLLVIVTDSIGNTMFLDNQYCFSGPYHRVIELGPYGRGIYFINITNDAERIYRKIIIK
jgi:hypothetical protein